MSESASETRRDHHRDGDRARENERVERGMHERNWCEKEERDRKRVSPKRARTCMRLGNALIGLSDSFRVAPYRRDRFRFDKIEFHLTRVEYRERVFARTARAYPCGYFILTLVVTP